MLPLPTMNPCTDRAGDDTVLSWRRTRSAVVRNAVGIGIATGAYAVSFGAISTTSGLSVVQTAFLSLVMFTGASQFALVGVMAVHGSPFASAATAILLGSRNALYGLRLSSLLCVVGLRRLPAAHLVIDESTAMAVAPESERAGRLGFWATGISVYVCWNCGTLFGAIGSRAVSNPKSFGLDAAVPAAFLALLAPRLHSRESWSIAGIGVAIALIAVSFVPSGFPMLLAAMAVGIVGLSRAHSSRSFQIPPESPAEARR